MRSKIVKKIISETPDYVKSYVESVGNAILQSDHFDLFLFILKYLKRNEYVQKTSNTYIAKKNNKYILIRIHDEGDEIKVKITINNGYEINTIYNGYVESPQEFQTIIKTLKL